MSKKNVTRPFGAKDKVGYMFGDFGCNMSFQLISSYIMLFMTQGMGLSLGSWAIIVMIAKIFDAINDPIIGALVDARNPGKYGKFKPWIFCGSFAIAITTVLLFVDIRAFSYAGRFAYCLIMYMVWSVAYTAANVPYGSLNAALTDDAGQRASLSSLRSIGAGLAMLPIMVIIPLLAYDDNDALKPDVFVWIAVVCGIVGIIGFMLTIFMTKERMVQPAAQKKFNYAKTISSFFKNRAILALCVASFAQLVFILSYAVTLPLVFQFYFGNTKLISMAQVLVMLPMMVFIPVMSKISVKYGKKEICSWPNLVGVVVLLIMLFIPFPRTSTGGWIYMALFMLAMLGGGTFTLATWSMVADCVDAQEVQSGEREEASVYATYSLARKVAQGVGASIVALILGAVGYATEGMTSEEIVTHNSVEAVAHGILNVSIILPLIGFVLVFLVMLFMYNLPRKKVESNTIYLRDKRAQELIDTSATRLFYDEDVPSEPSIDCADETAVDDVNI